MKKLGWRAAVGLCVAGVAAFHLAYAVDGLGILVAVYLLCLFRLAWVKTPRMAFWLGLTVGLATIGPQLSFFWGIFGVMAMGLWVLLALWIAFFLLIARLCVGSFGNRAAMLLMPAIWMGLEYFRCEVYYLRFAWLSPGLALAGNPALGWFGVYGMGFALMALVAIAHLFKGRQLLAAAVVMMLLTFMCLPFMFRVIRGTPLQVVGVQTEGMTTREIVHVLDRAIEAHPRGDVFVLSEYAFGEPVPVAVRDWCAEHKKFLVAGGMEFQGGQPQTFRDTAYVVGPDGKIVFSQCKCVPIQFMNDGLPATEQKLWNSPWGKIGICVCYDLSYTRVTDQLVQMGAQALIVPTMDAVSWGEHEHLLHSRIGPARAAEYGIPVVRAASSGISQVVQGDGTVSASAGFPGAGKVFAGRIVMSHAGGLPLDRYVAPVCVAGVGVVLAGLIIVAMRGGGRVRRNDMKGEIVGASR